VSVLEVGALSFAYPGGRPVLDEVDFRVEAGERVALLGPNGAGKSTLLLHLNGLLRGRGFIRVCGVRLEDATLAQVRARVGLVFQDPDDQLFCPTVFDDVAFGPLYMGLGEGEVRERVARALQAVGLSGFEGRPPHKLSGGEKKRAAIATVLAMDPSLLVFDEPTAGLDPAARRELIELMRRLPQALLVATHDLAMVAELFPRAVVMHQGRIVADGSTADVIGDRALLARCGLAG
jgi:cobalt/nickel transport system ATP-binding protein